MEHFNLEKHPKHLTVQEYERVISFIDKANEEEICKFLDVINVKFSGGNKGIDKEQVIFVVDSDTEKPEIKEKMMKYIDSK